MIDEYTGTDTNRLEPVTLEGQVVRLEPLSLDHVAALSEIGLDPSIWTYVVSVMRNADDMRAYVEEALRGQAQGKMLPFATIERASGQVVGSTRYDEIDVKHRTLEIGWTWINPRWQRTAINTEAKYLMLRHAFETLHCMRVQLRTDSLNDRSHQAILRLGAKPEGLFRNHKIMPSGRIRHSLFSASSTANGRTLKRI